MIRPPHLPLPDKILYLEDLTVSFDGFKALDDLTLYVDPGELRCIIGPNGAGKTTMMDVDHRQDASGSRLGVVRRRTSICWRCRSRRSRRRASGASFRSRPCSSS